MMCPKCKKSNAYLYSEDGITQPGIQDVVIVCPDCTGAIGSDGAVADITIQVVCKRGTKHVIEG